MSNKPAKTPNRLTAWGDFISEKVADFSGNPFAQIGVLILCAAWFIIGLRVDILTAALSILAITLTQMVLNRQDQREQIAHIHDLALHAKLDELLHASKRARDELAGIEDTLEEEEIAELKENGSGNVAAHPTRRRTRTAGKA